MKVHRIAVLTAATLAVGFAVYVAVYHVTGRIRAAEFANRPEAENWTLPYLGADQARNTENDTAPPAPTDETDARQRIRDLEHRLEHEQRLREAAERNAEDLRRYLRMLEAAGPRPPVPRRWWTRRH